MQCEVIPKCTQLLQQLLLLAASRMWIQYAQKQIQSARYGKSGTVSLASCFELITDEKCAKRSRKNDGKVYGKTWMTLESQRSEFTKVWDRRTLLKHARSLTASKRVISNNWGGNNIKTNVQVIKITKVKRGKYECEIYEVARSKRAQFRKAET